MKRASEYEIRFGHGLLQDDSRRWPRYVAVSTPSAWEVAEKNLSRRPAGLVFNKWLDRAHLEETTRTLPDDAELAVGIGAGRALDHAKVVAARKGIPLVQVPTVVSTGAIIHGFCGDWTGRVIHGKAAEVDAEYVIVDYDLVLEAPEHLNTAGLGDVLCGYAGICEWRTNTRRGAGVPFDAQIAQKTIAHHEYLVQEFPRTLDGEGRLTPDSVRFIMKAVQDRDEKMLRHPSAPSADHSFCFALELANDKYWIHGEECALGAVLVAWHSGEKPNILIDRLDTCKVRWRPGDMGISKDELSRGLAELPRWMGDSAHGRNVDSVMRREPVVGERFEECWRWLRTV